MSYVTPPDRRPSVAAVLEALEGAERVVLTTHVNADGDGCGSEIALADWLIARGAEAHIVNPTPYPDRFRFLLDAPDRVLDAGGVEAAECCREADLAVVLDTGEVTRLGRVKPMIEPLPTVVIDHHPPGERPIEGIGIRDASASATGELVYDVIDAAGGPWTPTVDLGLYVAILTDTGGFRFSNSSADCHRIVAELVERGVEPDAVHRQIYGSMELRTLRLLRACLAELELDPAGGLAWMTVPPDAYLDLEAGPDDLEGLVDYPRALKGVEVGLLFRVVENGAVKVSLRSNGDVDVNRIARAFGGGGHVKAAGALVRGSLETVRGQVLDATRAAVAAELEGGARMPSAGDEDPMARGRERSAGNGPLARGVS